MRYSTLSSVVIAGLTLVAAFQLTANGQEEGVVLYDFRGLKDSSDLTKAPDLVYQVGVDFGPWRQQQPKRIQWIECWLQNVKLPDGQPESFLAVYYSVPGKDSANGVYWKLHGEDYSSYSKGDLLVRMCQLAELTKERGGTLPTDVVTVEFKVSDTSGRLQEAQLEMTFSRDHKRQQLKYGTFDLRIPLVDFGDEHGNIDLTQCEEFVITFSNRTTPVVMQRGVVGVQAILLVKDQIEERNTQERFEKERAQVDRVLKAHRVSREK